MSRQPTRGHATDLAVADDDLQQEICDRLKRRWATYFPSLAAAAAATAPEVVCQRGADAHGFSVLFEYEVKFADICTKHVVAKVRRDSRFGPYRRQEVTLAPELLRLEFEELSRAHRYFHSLADGLGVVRPLDYLDDLNAVLMEKASGCDLGRLARFDGALLLAAFTRCGQWLRAFHREIHEARTRVWTVGELEARLVKRRQKLLAQGVPATRLDPLLHCVVEAAHACHQREVPCSVLHGDYKLRHVWADRGSIQVFDFGNVHAGDCYADVASFLVELSVLRLGSPSFDSKKIDRYSEAVLSGYFATERPPLLGFYTVEALLKKWMRRLRSWSRTAMVSRLQMGARRVGAAPLVDRLYLDRWFMARVRESLDAAVAQDVESSVELRG